MPPPAHGTQRLSAHLNRSRTAAIYGLLGFSSTFGAVWIALITGAHVGRSERLGPVCLLLTLGLMVLTIVGVACSLCVWWLAATWQRWLLYMTTEVAGVFRLLAEAINTPDKVANSNGLKDHEPFVRSLTHLTPGPRR